MSRQLQRRTLWHRTGPSIPVDDAIPPTDAFVVGAGITGLTAAVLLARSGMRVTVLEAAQPGELTTGGTTGKLSLLQGTVLSEIREHSGDDVLHAYVEANREGQAWLLRTLEGRGAEECTAFTLAQTEAGVDALDSELAAAHEVGIPAERVADAGVPFEIAGALRLRGQAQLHPMHVLAVLAAELRDRGGSLVADCRVRGATADESVVLDTSKGELEASLCVLATGMPILDRGMFFARLEPTRSLVAAYRVDAGRLPEGVHVTVDDPYRSIRTAAGADGETVLLVGGGAHATGRGGSLIAELERLDDWVEQQWPGAVRECSWAAQDYRSHSRVPFAGPIPGGRDRILAATGYNAWGMTNSVAAAHAMVSYALGGRNDWAEALREHGSSVATATAAARANTAVAGRLLGGWIPLEFAPSCDPRRLQEGEGVITRAGISPVAISRVDGKTNRVSGICPHMGGILRWNDLECSWDCPLHGSRFGADGTRIEGPAVDDLEPK